MLVLQMKGGIARIFQTQRGLCNNSANLKGVATISQIVMGVE